MLMVSDLSSSELQQRLGVSSNLLAHHLSALERRGLVSRRRSEGDQRRSYARLEPEAWGMLSVPEVSIRLIRPAPGKAGAEVPERIVFVCTGNSARSPFAAALWNNGAGRARTPGLKASSAGTHPAPAPSERAVRTAESHGVDLSSHVPRQVEDLSAGDLVIAVCDRAHEELTDSSRQRGRGTWAQHHWSVPNPGSVDTEAAYDSSFAELAHRLSNLTRAL